MNIYRFEDYKSFLKAQIVENNDVYGYQAKCATAAGCQKTYLSQVLHKNVHFTPDHAARLANFWNFDDDATEYFLLLVQQERAASKVLRERIGKKLSLLRSKHLNLGKRFNQPELTNSDRASRYYHHWTLAAVHLLLGIPEYSFSLEKISKRIGVPISQVQTIVRDLETLELVEKKDRAWCVVRPSIHVSRESPLNQIHQLNWRLRAVDALARKNLDNTHYSALYVLSTADFKKLQQMVHEFIGKTRDVVGPSKEEELVCFNLDLFQV